MSGDNLGRLVEIPENGSAQADGAPVFMPGWKVLGQAIDEISSPYPAGI